MTVIVIKKTIRKVIGKKCSAKHRLLVNKKEEHIFGLCYDLSLETTSYGTKQ